MTENLNSPRDAPDWDSLFEVAQSQAGYFTTRQAAGAGYSPQLLAFDRFLERLGAAVFSRPSHTDGTSAPPWGKLFHEKVAPMLEPELHHQAIVPRCGSYAAKLIGCGEVEAP